VSFGDGATNTGSFHEGMNLAATWQLPVIFICQNNGFAEMTPIAETMHIEQVADRALAYAMPGERVDGNDPEAVYRAVVGAAERGRAGGGPTFLECVTFRFEGHYVGDPQPYMPEQDLAAAQSADPIPVYRQKLRDGAVLTEAELAAIEEESSTRVEDALREVLAAPVPEEAEIDSDFLVDLKGVPA
jgi:acetoin:2,6-dichlorophenolindophenol oxidoreductase subunit alpha